MRRTDSGGLRPMSAEENAMEMSPPPAEAPPNGNNNLDDDARHAPPPQRLFAFVAAAAQRLFGGGSGGEKEASATSSSDSEETEATAAAVAAAGDDDSDGERERIRVCSTLAATNVDEKKNSTSTKKTQNSLFPRPVLDAHAPAQGGRQEQPDGPAATATAATAKPGRGPLGAPLGRKDRSPLSLAGRC